MVGIGTCGVRLAPLAQALKDHILGHGVIHADETTVALLAPGRGKTRRDFVRVYRTTNFTAQRAALFGLATSRAGEHPRRMLHGFAGTLVSDDCSGHVGLQAQGVTAALCWAHARRKLYEAHQLNGSQIAGQAVALIAKLHEFERGARELQPEARWRLRQQRAKPIVEALHTRLAEQQQRLANADVTAKAIDYSLSTWRALTRYLDDGNVPIGRVQMWRGGGRSGLSVSAPFVWRRACRAPLDHGPNAPWPVLQSAHARRLATPEPPTPPMNQVELAWMAIVAACLTLALLHLMVWVRERGRLDFLVFAVLAAAAAAFGVFELQMMHAATPQAAAVAIRAAHVPLAVVVVAIAVFVRLHFGTGRNGLLLAIVVLRLATLVLNFSTGVNANFEQVSELGHVVFWGGSVVSVPLGPANPWTRVPQLSNLLLLIFVADASLALWRRGDRAARRRAALVGGSVAAFVATTGTLAALTVYGAVALPTVLMPTFMLVLLAMSYELSGDVLRAAALARELAVSEQRLRAVVEAAPSAILLVDAAGRIVLANRQAERDFGLARERLVGREVETLIPERLRQHHQQLREAYAARPRPRAMGGDAGSGRDFVALRADGSEFPVEISLAPLRNGANDQVLVALADISERRRAEQLAAQQRVELAHLSRVAMLGELSGALAHEINQPLAAILSNAQAAQRFLARDPSALQPVHDALQAIVASDHRASQVIERLRALLRKGEALREAVDLNELVEDSLRLLRSDLAHRGVEIELDLQPALPALQADRVQLQQLLLNLMLNACEAMEGQLPPRPLSIRTAHVGDARSVCVEVADRGAGIAASDAQRVFEPFYTTKPRGLGLGLPLCRSIVQAHDGRIEVSHNPGGGARLRVELPVAQARV